MTNGKIAVTYENGQVFQHFGHSAQFKLYTVQDGKITSSEVLDTNGSGHGAHLRRDRRRRTHRTGRGGNRAVSRRGRRRR